MGVYFKVLFLIGLAGVFSAGCQTLRTPAEVSYEATYDRQVGISELAITAHRQAIEQLEKGELATAELTLRQCLASDNQYGNAHNTLGKALFSQGKYYAAAWEFETASRLMPERPEPINNLGLVFERADLLNEAVPRYEAAWQMARDNPEYLGNLLRARVKRGDRTDDLQELFTSLLLLETRPAWSKWAEDQLQLGRARPRPSRTESGPDLNPEVIETAPGRPPAARDRELDQHEELPAPHISLGDGE